MAAKATHMRRRRRWGAMFGSACPGYGGLGQGPHIRWRRAFMTHKRLARRCGLVAACAGVACLAVGVPTASAGPGGYSPGAAGIGDPYFPLEGNGGYDVQHYDLRLSNDPGTDRLDALNKITARAAQDLSRFDLDFQQLTVKGVEVNDRAAAFTRDGQELVITPSDGIADGAS